jgi:prepilin-type N-terminal cleavage/methylation domain-containing protein
MWYSARNTQYAIRNTKKGFSLLEVMLAILLFGTGLVFLLQVVNTGLFVGGQNEDTVIAANLAQEKIEESRNAAYSAIVSEIKAVVAGFPDFKRRVDMTTPQTGLKQISVTVYWYARSDEMSVNMVTYVSDV